MPNILTALPHSGRYLAINITYHSIFYIQSHFWDQCWRCVSSLYCWWPFDPEVGGGCRYRLFIFNAGLANILNSFPGIQKTEYLFSTEYIFKLIKKNCVWGGGGGRSEGLVGYMTKFSMYWNIFCRLFARNIVYWVTECFFLYIFMCIIGSKTIVIEGGGGGLWSFPEFFFLQYSCQWCHFMKYWLIQCTCIWKKKMSQ